MFGHIYSVYRDLTNEQLRQQTVDFCSSWIIWDSTYIVFKYSADLFVLLFFCCWLLINAQMFHHIHLPLPYFIRMIVLYKWQHFKNRFQSFFVLGCFFQMTRLQGWQIISIRYRDAPFWGRDDVCLCGFGTHDHPIEVDPESEWWDHKHSSADLCKGRQRSGTEITQ